MAQTSIFEWENAMAITFDQYSRRARVFPVYLTILPFVLVLFSVLPEGLTFPLGGAAAIVFVPISFFFAQAGADFGKRLEGDLWRKWGGPPTTLFLRNSNLEFNEVTRHRIHENLRNLGLHVPSKDDELKDPFAADKHFESCTEELIRRTRNTRRFPLVFSNLTAYGFRRNLLGLKPIGVLLTCVGIVFVSYVLLKGWQDYGQIFPFPATGFLMMLGLLSGWLAWVNEESVRLSADRYARSLLEAALDLE